MRTRLSLLALLFTLFTPIAHAQPGSLDLSFNPGAGFNGPVNALVVQSDDKLICVGQFTTYQGVSRRGIVRINVDGSIDNTFTTGTGFASVSPPTWIRVALQGMVILARTSTAKWHGPETHAR
ncbi:MAG: delta-60 repeat domain-containing protein [Flavobacteriales bacterium]|nr:delta-60 repeat domain-containing protein [Flavobacteriales bacterium]